MYGLIFYMVAQGIIVGSIAVAGIFQPEIWQMFGGSSGMIGAEVIKNVTLISTCAYAVCATGLLVLSDIVVAKGVDID